MLSRVLITGAALVVAMALFSCNESDPVCEAGRAEACACPGGGEGTQQCAMDGSNWLECDCSNVFDPCEYVTCSSRGECFDVDGDPECDCDEGFDGEDCSICAEGYHRDDDDCVEDESCEDLDCGDHGSCSIVRGLAICSCDDGWSGSTCDVCYPGYHDEDGP